MFNIVLLIILFILFFISIYYSKNNICTCDDIVENMINNNNNTFLNNGTSLIIKNDIYKPNEPIEITKLPTCERKIKVDYGLNIENIINDSITISQNINDPLLHTIEIDDHNYNLIKIEWRKTNFTINNKPIGLSLHLIHNDYKSINNFIIIIPLDLSIENKSVENNNVENNNVENNNVENNNVENNNIENNNVENNNVENNNVEGFKNTLYKKMTDYTKIYNPTNIINNSANVKDSILNNNSINPNNENIIVKNKFNLSFDYLNKSYDVKKINVNLLFKKDANIPKYECCGKTIGQTLHTSLCPLKTIIENNNKYYIIKEENGNYNLITEPSVYSKEKGLLIRNYIKNDSNLVYIK